MQFLPPEDLVSRLPSVVLNLRERGGRAYAAGDQVRADELLALAVELERMAATLTQIYPHPSQRIR